MPYGTFDRMSLITLAGKSRHIYNGKELEMLCFNPDIRMYICGCSFRFVYYRKRKPISGIQFLFNFHTKEYLAANIFTLEKFRRQGYCRQIWIEATKHFSKFRSSNNLSEDGKQFMKYIKQNFTCN